MKLFKALSVLALLLFAVPLFAQNEVLLKSGTPIVFGDDANLNPVDDATNFTDDIGTDTADCDLDHTALANGAAHQSLKCSLGATWALSHMLIAAVDFSGETPTIGNTIDYYWCPSTDTTQAQSNVWGNSGANAAVCDGCVGAPTDAEFVKMCIFIGSLVTTDDATVQSGIVGILSPPAQWGQLVVFNNSGDAFEADNIEAHAVLYPVITEIQ